MVERDGLENRCIVLRYRGFESHPLRHPDNIRSSHSQRITSSSVSRLRRRPATLIRRLRRQDCQPTGRSERYEPFLRVLESGTGESTGMPTRSPRRGARVDDWARLESVCTFTGTVGSNPTPSAILTAS